MAEAKTKIINSSPINTKFLPTCTAAQKYVSMFRIDGVPILPPLMTPEKRRQMHKLKERALKVEQRLEEYRRRRERYNLEYSTVVEDVNQPPQVVDNDTNCSSSSSSPSDHESELDAQRKEVEKSYMLLTDLLVQNNNETKTLMTQDDSSNSTMCEAFELDTTGLGESRSSETNLLQRMQKLQKSETLIYDYRGNTLIQALSEDEVQIFQQQQQQINLDHPEEKPIGSKCSELQDKKCDDTANLDYITRQKSVSACTDKVLKKIPSICIDPPTPINGARTFCEALQPCNSIDAINLNEQSEKSKKEVSKSLLHQEISSDESSNCLGHSANLEHEFKTHRKVTKITSKILKFENFSLDESRKRSNIKPPQRSATSPSLKLSQTERAPQALNKSLELKNEMGLVRSNSFTIDYPSKALIEHIRQQQTPHSNEHYPSKRTNLISTSITRDTVESKAKRVQKVDLKPRTQTARLQLKPSSTNLTSPSSATTSYQSSFSKPKRSPYETKSTKPKVARQLKKSVSGTTAIKQMKPRPSMPSIQNAGKLRADSMTRNANTSVNTNYSGIEAEHRKKFLELLAHQKREQQRMQQVFEEQQQYLLEQLTAKMGSVHMQQQEQSKTTTPPHPSSKMFGGHSSSVDNSPTVRADYNESALTLQSPTRSMNNSVSCDVPSLELSSRSSTLPASTSQSSNTRTPRRRLFSRGGDISPSASNRSIASLCSNNVEAGGAANCVGRSNGTMAVASSSRRSTADLKRYEEAKRRAAAVTTINAYVRGYLVRRLFQTEQIQRVVQTIRDTLMFVLSLHIETCQDPVEAQNPTNIKLKTQLVKQLTSAIRTLHLILFNTSVKERMEIISRDRKRIKTKMLAMNMKRSPQFRI